MGFLNFLLRKHSSTNNLATDIDTLKAQSYVSTIAAKPPILGAYPVAGNGTTFLERIQQTQPGVNNVVFDSSAPPPIVPRVHSESVERPKTAPPKQVSGTAKRQGPPYKLPPKIWSTPDTELKPTFAPPTPAFSRERASSIISSNSKGFVDLLDAQSIIKPSDFRSRVKATGARDYGEDVADRNIGENGIDVDSAPVREYYIKNFGAIPTSYSDILEGDQLREPRKRHSIATGLGIESLASSNRNVHPKNSSNDVSEKFAPHGRTLGTSMKDRRNSLHSYVALSSSTSRPRGSSKRRKFSDSDTHGSSIAQQEPRFAYESDSDMATEATSPTKISRSSENNRGSVKHTHAHVSRLGAFHDYNASQQSTTSWEESHESKKHASRRQTIQYVPYSTVAKPSSKRHSLQSFQPPSRQELLRDSNSRKSTLSNGSKSMEGVSSRLNFGIASGPGAYPSSNSNQASSERDDGLNELVRRVRAQSIASISSKDVKPSDIEDIVPERNSSLRNYSLTSETATYSSISSNPFRPASRHTPSTSIDLTPTVPFFTFTNPSQNNLSIINNSPQKGQNTRSAVGPPSVASIPVAYKQKPQRVSDIDEYASSSDDSFENPHKPCGEKEKELLFVESVYGFNGAQFPGLPGVFGAATSRPTTAQSSQIRIKAFHSPTSSVSGESDEEWRSNDTSYSSRHLENGHLFRSRGIQESGFNRFNSERNEECLKEESSDDEISFDIPRSRTSTMRYNSIPAHSNRPRYDTANSVIDEEDDSTLDIATLMRKRRDMKTKRRESGSVVRRVQSIRKLNGITTVPVADDHQSGYVTDVEQ